MIQQVYTPFRDMRILYRAMLYGQLVLWVLALICIQFNLIRPGASQSLDRLLQVIAVCYSFLAVWVGVHLFRRRLESIKTQDLPVREKLSQYKSASVVQWALLEGAGLFCIICYFITGNWAFLGLSITTLAIFGALNPFKQKILLQLKLQEQDVIGIG